MSLGLKSILLLSFIGFYFLLLRPVRSGAINTIRTNIEFADLDITSSSSTGLNLDYKNEGFIKRFNFKSPFGMFFLFSGITLIFMSVGWKKLGTLTLLHFSLWIIAFICFLIGGKGNIIFLQVMDFFVSYLIPLCTLGYPLYLIIEKKMDSSS